MTQLPRVPDVAAQRAAMKKLSFLIGKWSGEASVLRAGGTVDLLQTEEAQYQLDGLLLMIEGVGRNKSDGRLVLQALGLISYDDEAASYRMRTFNDGRWLESDVKLDDSGKGLMWGFSVGEVKTHSILRINEMGQWTELAELTIGSQSTRKLMEVTVSRLE